MLDSCVPDLEKSCTVVPLVAGSHLREIGGKIVCDNINVMSTLREIDT